VRGAVGGTRTMDFPDLGAAVAKPKREKMPRAPRQGGGGGGERRPKSELQAMLDKQNGPAGGVAAGAGTRSERANASAEGVPVHVFADIGPPPKHVQEPDAAAHAEATAAIQERIDEGEKRVVRLWIAARGRWAARPRGQLRSVRRGRQRGEMSARSYPQLPAEKRGAQGPVPGDWIRGGACAERENAGRRFCTACFARGAAAVAAAARRAVHWRACWCVVCYAITLLLPPPLLLLLLPLPLPLLLRRRRSTRS